MVQQSDASSPPPSSPGGGGSPRIKDFSPIAKDTRKRKALSKWTTKIQVSQETECKGLREDGTYKWRKYGLSKVIGARFLRGYYSCAFKHKAKCPATKRVQRCDEDPTFVQVTYKGLHTCSHLATADPALALAPSSSSQSQDLPSYSVGSRSTNATITSSVVTPSTTSTIGSIRPA